MNKKTILWAISLIILGIATIYGTLYYLQWRDKQLWEKQRQKEQGKIQEKELTEEEKLIKKQSEELDRQRREAGTQPLSEEEIRKQIEELDRMQKESGVQPPTEEEIKKQMEELDRLHQLQQ